MNLAHLLLRTARSQPERPALAVGTALVSLETLNDMRLAFPKPDPKLSKVRIS